MLLENRVIFAENIHVSVLAKKWLEDMDSADSIEFMTYLTILPTLGKSN